MSEGKLFAVETGPRLVLHPGEKRRGARPQRRVEYRWLCDDCSRYLTIAHERGRGVITVPLPNAAVKKPVGAVLEPMTWAAQRNAARGQTQ